MWECGDCGHPETRTWPVDAACHHCGLLLCRACRIVVVDAAFGGPLASAARTAVHCRPCRRSHHPAAVALGGGVAE